MDHPFTSRLDRPVLIGALVLSGVAPILALTAMAVFEGEPRSGRAVHALIAYSAVVVGFLGGLRWGVELRRAPASPNPVRLTCAAAATVVGWVALLLAPLPALLLLLAAAGAQLTWDVYAARTGHMPAWTAPLRVATSGLAALCLAAVAVTISPD